MNLKYKVVLLDVDGVLIIPPKLFSQQYCEKFGKNEALLENFYSTKEFKDSSLGKFDLKEAIRMHNDLWQWDGEPEEVLDMWFNAEREPNTELLETMQLLRNQGVPIYLASQQEKYRASYLRDVVFANKVDGTFFTCDIKFGKNDDSYWEAVLHELTNMHPDITPGEMIYFDDRASLVEKANEFGISAFLYQNNDEVKKRLV